MSMEILYYIHNAINDTAADLTNQTVRWLTVDEYNLFCEHLELCGQRILEKTKWEQAYADGTVYCGLFIDRKMVSRACVEKYSHNAWEVSDVRTVKQYRGNGYAFRVCSFVLRYILSQSRTATIRTEEDNEAMKTVIKKLGFSVL